MAAQEPIKLSYFQKRMKELGITDELNKITTPIYEFRPGHDWRETKTENEKTYPLFLETPDGDIKILYYSLTGSPYHYRKEGNKNQSDYFRIRHKVPRVYTDATGEKKEAKYDQPGGSGQFPYFPPAIIKKYLEQTEIETLVVVEGEFKSMKGSLAGIDIIGIPSIHGFYSADGDHRLHEDIQELIIACKVKKVVYLTDADTLTVKWEEGKDLRKRINSFNAAVKNFRNSLQLLLDNDDIPLSLAYFMHLRTKYVAEDAKGLDDLLVKYEAKTDDIKEDLLQLDLAKKYFNGINVSDNRFSDTIYKYFGLSTIETFYAKYKDYIGNREFRYSRSRYQWNGEYVAHTRHEDADKYFRVGADWFKVILVPNKDEELEEEIIPFKIGEITRDYKKWPDFIDQLQRFDAFCNVPSWNGTYLRKIGECYNVTNPLTHEIKQGSIVNTLSYLKHTFGGKANIKEYWNIETKEPHWIEWPILGDPFTIILDYLTLQFQRPKQQLFVPILVSPEQGTGKSTFLKWLREIYGSNATILDNERFKMSFNSHYITKFIIGLDEGFLDIEKKAEKERLKQMATADEAYMERKGIDLKRFPYYGKLIICSNDADKVMQMDPEDRRWFVVRVPKLERKDINLRDNMKAEIPAWLHFLKNREVFHPKEDDLWFKTEYIITEQFQKIVETTKSRIDKVVEEYIKDMFLLYREPTLRLDMLSMLEAMNDPKTAKYKIDEKDLKYYLEERKGLAKQPAQRIKIPCGHDDNGHVNHKTKVARPYIFESAAWLTDDEMREFNQVQEFKAQVHMPGKKKEKDKTPKHFQAEAFDDDGLNPRNKDDAPY